MNKTKRINNKGFILLSIALMWAMLFCPSLGFAAGLEVSVAGGDWAIGTTGANMTTTSGTEGRTDDKWTVTGSSDGYENIYIKVDGTNWHPASSAGANTFVLKHDASGSWGSAITNTDNGILLKQNLMKTFTQKFDLQFTSPASGLETEQTLTVTLTATNWASAGRVFVTSTTYNGNLGGLTGGDAKCQARADAVSLGGTWTAWLSTMSGTNAKDRIVDHAYFLTDGTLVATSIADLTDGTLSATILYNESGTTVGSVTVMTSTRYTGLTYNVVERSCSNWTSSSSGVSALLGNTAYTNSNWTDYQTLACDGSFHIYCFEQ